MGDVPDLLALKPEPDRFVQCGGDDERPSPMFHLYTLLQYGERVAEEAVRQEREAAAKACEALHGGVPPHTNVHDAAVADCAAAIRARSEQ